MNFTGETRRGGNQGPLRVIIVVARFALFEISSSPPTIFLPFDELARFRTRSLFVRGYFFLSAWLRDDPRGSQLLKLVSTSFPHTVVRIRVTSSITLLLFASWLVSTVVCTIPSKYPGETSRSIRLMAFHATFAHYRLSMYI